MAYLLVFLGGGAGAALRHGVNGMALRLAPGYPWGTFTVNVVGSLAMGLLIGALAMRGGSMETRALLATGLLGGFTTFSAFSLDVVMLWQRGDVAAAIAYAGGSVVIAVLAVLAGMALASRTFGVSA